MGLVMVEGGVAGKVISPWSEYLYCNCHRIPFSRYLMSFRKTKGLIYYIQMLTINVPRAIQGRAMHSTREDLLSLETPRLQSRHRLRWGIAKRTFASRRGDAIGIGYVDQRKPSLRSLIRLKIL